VFGTTLVLLSSAIVGLALYALYAVLRPDLLAERHAGLMARVRASGRPPDRVAHELERLATQQAQYLDPAWQALGTAGTLLFFGMLLALYSAWRWQVAERLARGPGARPDPPAGCGPWRPAAPRTVRPRRLKRRRAGRPSRRR
jgi:hypothetical protein